MCVCAGFAAGAAIGIIILICIFILVCDRRRRPYIGSTVSRPLGNLLCVRCACGCLLFAYLSALCLQAATPPALCLHALAARLQAMLSAVRHVARHIAEHLVACISCTILGFQHSQRLHYDASRHELLPFLLSQAANADAGARGLYNAQPVDAGPKQVQLPVIIVNPDNEVECGRKLHLDETPSAKLDPDNYFTSMRTYLFALKVSSMHRSSLPHPRIVRVTYQSSE